MVKSHCMELKVILEFFKKNLKILGLSCLLFGILGVLAYYFLPPKYYATGSLFVRRASYPYSENHFTYEGYYSQQAGMFYTNSVLGLIESEDIRAQALNTLEIPINEVTLRRYERKIRTVKSGPQLVGLIAKDDTSDKAGALWQAVANSTINTMNNISRQNDPFVGVLKISEDPIIKESYRNIVVFTLVGVCFGLIFSTTYLALSNYLTKSSKK